MLMYHESFPGLAAFNARLDDCTSCATVARGYRHVPGGGCVDQPELMLVFINPTFRNITSPADWPGRRMPFAGRPKLWQILAEAGWVGAEVPQIFERYGATPEAVELLHAAARDAGLYLSNAVKCVDAGSNLPTPERVRANLPQLQAEIALVQPRSIVAMGLIPFGALTGRTVRLADELWAAQSGDCRAYPTPPIAGQRYPVFPCYFPTGRGNPVAATRMLAALRRHLHPAP